MKKIYMTPNTMMVYTETCKMICGSEIHSDKGINYGGVDEEGTKEPEGRRSRDNWDDDDEEEKW